MLTVPPEVTARRMAKRDLDRFERAGGEFHARVERGFATMAAADPERWLVVDASVPHEDVVAMIRSSVQERFGI